MQLLAPIGIELDGANVHLPNVAPDEGLSAPFNSWFTLFGQFFDHGLDLVNKGGSGTVFIPLQPDDPLYVAGQPHQLHGADARHRFGRARTASWAPPTTCGPSTPRRPIVDQNQTYTSHPSHQVFLRQYVLDADGEPVATGKLIEGANGGMATWGEVKAQARTARHRADRLRCRQRAAAAHRPYGNFIPERNGYPAGDHGIGADGIPNTADDIVVSGTPTAPVNPDDRARRHSYRPRLPRRHRP